MLALNHVLEAGQIVVGTLPCYHKNTARKICRVDKERKSLPELLIHIKIKRNATPATEQIQLISGTAAYEKKQNSFTYLNSKTWPREIQLHIL